MKTVIIYASMHHGNTQKVVESIGQKYEVDLIDAHAIRVQRMAEAV